MLKLIMMREARDTGWLKFNLIIFLLVLLIPVNFVRSETTRNFVDLGLFYGHNSLDALVDKDKPIISLPGGTLVIIGDGPTTTWLLPDHLESARVAMTGDNVVSGQTTYTPFGDRRVIGESDSARSYTGLSFEDEIGTFNYHARWYDGSVGRFDRVDAARESISPYSYAKNNPINFVDPTGLGGIPFFLKSGDQVSYLLGVSQSVSRQLALTLDMRDRVSIDKVHTADGFFGFDEQGDVNASYAGVLNYLKRYSDGINDSFSRRAFWFIFEHDETTTNPPINIIRDRLRALRRHQSDFMEDITVLDFTQDSPESPNNSLISQKFIDTLSWVTGRDPLVIKAERQKGVKPTKFSNEYLRPKSFRVGTTPLDLTEFGGVVRTRVDHHLFQDHRYRIFSPYRTDIEVLPPMIQPHTLSGPFTPANTPRPQLRPDLVIDEGVDSVIPRLELPPLSPSLSPSVHGVDF